ncbi:MAG: diversity-generating retroelement protein bAvd family protein [Aquimarina sp.]|nr:diversity-generating retroelement protein bAvd family protein [Aquimarina sp.]
MRDFKELKVWEKAHELTLNVYRVTENFPIEEKFGIVSQLRRAVSSVPTNIAEGSGHNSNKEFGRFLKIASASISEVEYLVLLSKDLNLIDKEIWQSITDEVVIIRKMLFKLVKALD